MGGFNCCCLFRVFCVVGVFLFACVCVCFMSSPSHSAGLQSLSEVNTFLGGGKIMATEVKVTCWKDHLFS